MIQDPSLYVLQVGNGWFPEQPGNGLDRVYHALTHHLPGVGVGVSGLVVGANGTGQVDGQQIRRISADNALLSTRLHAFRRTIRDEMCRRRYDVVASHFALYTFPAIDLFQRHPLVVHFHGPWALESGVEGASALKVRVKSFIERTVYQRCDRLIVLSQAFRDVLHRDYGIPEERVRVVPGGVAVDRFATGLSRQAAREQLGWPADRPVLLAVRRLARRMGLENLVAAMKQVAARVPDVLLLIAGTGPLAAQLQACIEAAGLERNIRLLGFVPDADLPLAYRAADLTIVPTVKLEGFGLITVESLAAGTPVLVTPVGGLPEVVRGLSEDLVLPDAEVDTISEHVTAALTGSQVLPSAEACEAYAREHFDWPVIASKVRNVYEEVLA